MWRTGVLLSALAACGFELRGGAPAIDDADRPDDDAQDVAWLDGYDYRRPWTIASGQTVTLDDFTVAMIHTLDSAHVQRSDGADIVVTGADHVPLEYELESYDPNSGALVMWARIPSLAPTTTGYLYYGGAARSHDPKAAWSSETYAAVWHLTDPLVDRASDSAGMHEVSVSAQSATPERAPSLIGDGRTFDGDDALRDDDDDPSLDFGLASFSFSVWVRVEQSLGPWDMPIYKGGASATNPGYDMELGHTSWTTYVGDGMQTRYTTFGPEVLDAWVHLVSVVDREANLIRAYVDGTQTNTEDISMIGSSSSPWPLTLGASSGGTNDFLGQLDEVRVYRRGLSPAWIAAEHMNIKEPDTFVVLDAEKARP